tara:strand:- start:390 stop:1226 length:837 start_codon:yes stop_codon:yes gene_type:complete
MAFVPYMVGGYAVDKMMGGNGLKGAALGAGGSFLPGLVSGAGVAGNTAATSLMAGNALGAGGMATAGGMSTLGLGTAAGSGAAGLGQIGSVVTPEHTPGLLMDSAYNAPITPTDFYSGDVSMMQNPNIGNAQSLPIDYVDPAINGGYDASLGDTYLGNESMMANKNLGGIPGATQGTGGYDGGGLFSNAKDYISDGFNDMSFMDKANAGLTANKVINSQPQNMISPPPPQIDRRNPNPTMGKPLVTQIQGLQKAAPSAMMGQLSPKEQEEYYSLLRSI